MKANEKMWGKPWEKKQKFNIHLPILEMAE